MNGNFPTTDELGLDIPEGDYYEFNSGGDQPPSFETDLSALDTPVDRTEGDTAPVDTVKPDGQNTPQDQADQGDSVVFEQPAPIANWKEQAEAAGFADISSEQQFRDQLEINRYIQSNFYADPTLKEAYSLLSRTDVSERELIEYDIRSKLEEDEDETDVEDKLSKYVDEDGVVNEKGKTKAGFAKKRIEGLVAEAVTRLEGEAKVELGEQKTFHDTLKSAITALPSSRYTAAEKSELHKYITSGKYFQDAAQRDEKGNLLTKGADLATKLLENAERLHPAFAEKRMKAIYEDAKSLGVTEFLKKYKN